MAKIREEFIRHLATLVIGAFSFVAALSWNSAIVELINSIVPPGEQLAYKIATAIIVTFIAVVVIVVFSRFKR